MSRLSIKGAERKWLRTNQQTLGPLMQHTIRAARAEEMGAQHFANIAFGATQCHGDSGKRMRILFCALARVAERRLVEFTAQGLANTAWAFTKASHSDVQLFRALASVAERRTGDFSMQSLAITAWAFVTAAQPDTHLLKALAKAAEWCVGHFTL